MATLDLLLSELLAISSFVYISQDKEDQSYSVVMWSADSGVRKSVVHLSLEMALQEALYGKTATHKCSRCLKDKPLHQFYRYRAGIRLGRTQADRMPWYCKECERKRVRDYARRRRGEGGSGQLTGSG